MTTIKLPEKWINALTKMPESGMGTHHVDIILGSDRIIRNVTVFNSEDCQCEIVFDPHDIEEIRESHPKE